MDHNMDQNRVSVSSAIQSLRTSAKPTPARDQRAPRRFHLPRVLLHLGGMVARGVGGSSETLSVRKRRMWLVSQSWGLPAHGSKSSKEDRVLLPWDSTDGSLPFEKLCRAQRRKQVIPETAVRETIVR